MVDFFYSSTKSALPNRKLSQMYTETDKRIAEQESRIWEQEERIRSLKGLVQGLLSGGMTLEQIAQLTGQIPEEIRSLL